MSEGVRIDGDEVRIHELEIRDAALAGLLREQPPERWPDLVGRALSVGARGLLTMGLGLDVGEMDRRVRRSIDEVTSAAERRVAALLDQADEALSERFDPERRSSLMARALGEFTEWRDGLLAGFDPALADSHTSQFLRRIERLLGPGGELEKRLLDALDPEADGSGLARLNETVDRRLAELRDLFVGDRARAEEAARGTHKGLEFEEVVDGVLREIARSIGGCVVDHTGRTSGALGPDVVVGDFVLDDAGGGRIVIEAKHVTRIGLSGRDGILAELDRAMENREAQFAICVSATEAFPQEVGGFGVYGNRLLVVDDGDGTLLDVAVRWARAMLAIRPEAAGGQLDRRAALDRLHRIKELATTISSNQRALTGMAGTVESVQASLRGLRTDLLGLVDELEQDLCPDGSVEPAGGPAHLRPVAGV